MLAKPGTSLGMMWRASTKANLPWCGNWSHGCGCRARSHVEEWLAQVSSEPRAQHLSYGGFTPLLYATREGCLSCVQSLVEGGAKLNVPDPEGVTPLIVAITNAHFDTAKYLIEKGRDGEQVGLVGTQPGLRAVDMNTVAMA